MTYDIKDILFDHLWSIKENKDVFIMALEQSCVYLFKH